jgi:CHASE2 domain-containing sensor protein
VLVPAGLFLVAFALFVWLAGTRRRIAGTVAWAIVAVNALWVIGSVALVVAGWFPLTPLGVVFVVVQAAAVVLFACLQLIGLRRARPATR